MCLSSIFKKRRGFGAIAFHPSSDFWFFGIDSHWNSDSKDHKKHGVQRLKNLKLTPKRPFLGKIFQITLVNFVRITYVAKLNRKIKWRRSMILKMKKFLKEIKIDWNILVINGPSKFNIFLYFRLKKLSKLLKKESINQDFQKLKFV